MAHRLAPLVAAAVLVGQPALAADVAAPVAVPAVPSYEAPPAVYDWSGANLGGIAGFDIRDYDADGTDIGGDGAFAGIFAGYDAMVAPNIVAGVVADVTFGDNGGSEDAFDASSDYLATFRGRLGYAMDSWMLYGTGGLAVADLSLESGGESDSNTVFGYAVGAGVEAGITENVSARFEYLYIDTGAEDFDLGGTSTPADLDGHQFRVGLGYRF